jgi:type IV secretory pathway VirB10-like protein
MTWSASPRRARRRWLPIALAVVTFHLLLVLLWQRTLYEPSSRRSSERPPMLIWLRRAPPPAPPPEVVEAPPARVEAPRRRPRAAPVAEPEPAPAQAAAAPDSSTAPSPEPAASAAATAAASAPGGSLLDTEASRRAIREAGRQRSTSEMAGEASGAQAPLGAQERMGQEIARGARGDCLKGEYAGSGMGLLSLPFWLLAELREKCRR